MMMMLLWLVDGIKRIYSLKFGFSLSTATIFFSLRTCWRFVTCLR
uniref:Uncharacterized protein n=1 Tax=Rhizophora mucronata TaxID=61149 RepID=A0A2P2PWD4_RHIMU